MVNDLTCTFFYVIQLAASQRNMIKCDATKFEIFLVWVAPAEIFLHGCYSDRTPERRFAGAKPNHTAIVGLCQPFTAVAFLQLHTHYVPVNPGLECFNRAGWSDTQSKHFNHSWSWLSDSVHTCTTCNLHFVIAFLANDVHNWMSTIIVSSVRNHPPFPLRSNIAHK